MITLSEDVGTKKCRTWHCSSCQNYTLSLTKPAFCSQCGTAAMTEKDWELYQKLGGSQPLEPKEQLAIVNVDGKNFVRIGRKVPWVWQLIDNYDLPRFWSWDQIIDLGQVSVKVR